jgi:hypothetical protein
VKYKPNDPTPKLSEVAPFGANPEAFLTREEAAAIIGVSPGTVQRWIMYGKVRSFGLRGAIRVRLCDLMPVYEPISDKSASKLRQDGQPMPENPRGRLRTKFKMAKGEGLGAKPRSSESTG